MFMVVKIRDSWFPRVSAAALLAAVLGGMVTDRPSAAKGAETKVAGPGQSDRFHLQPDEGL